MLGTLARWLRILGYDALYDPALDDHDLVRLARAGDRILLTRDRPLAQRPGLRVLLIDSDGLDAQLHQVIAELDLAPDGAFSRCPICNEPLLPLEREAAQARVPAYVAQTQQSFKHCPSCGRVYWRGTHWQRMEEHLARLQAAGPGRQNTSE